MTEATKKLDVHCKTSDHAKTYVFHDEDHTLGNALRFVLMRNPQVEFCGYTIPHPSEPKMHLRLQTSPGMTSDEAIRSGLEDLQQLCSFMHDVYSDELVRFLQNKA